MTQRANHPHIWISPGALLGVVLSLCAIALLTIFVALPFWSQNAENEERRIAGITLLQRFDCTYGRSLEGALNEVVKIQQDTAERQLITIREAQASGDKDREAGARRARTDALESVGSVKLLASQLEPLSPTPPRC